MYRCVMAGCLRHTGVILLYTVLLLTAGCVEGTTKGNWLLPSENDVISYTSANYTLDGGIAAMNTAIAGLADNSKTTASYTIEGVVTMRNRLHWADYTGVTDYLDPGEEGYRVYKDVFFIQDKDAAVMVYYDNDYTFVDDLIDENYIPNLVLPGDHVRIQVNEVQKAPVSNMPLVTRFNPLTLEVVDSGLPVYVQHRDDAVYSLADAGKVFSISGTVTAEPPYLEFDPNVDPSDESYCPDELPDTCYSDYQPNYKRVFVSSLANEDDTLEWFFQLNLPMVRGALDSFALGNGERSFIVFEGDELTITGPLAALDYSTTEFRWAVTVADRIAVER